MTVLSLLCSLLPLFFFSCLFYRRAEENTKIILIGNKSDLETQRAVTYKEGAELAAHMGCPFYEVSSKEATNVEKALHTLVEAVMADLKTTSTTSSLGKKIGEEEGKEEPLSTLGWLYSKFQGLFM